MIASVSGGSTFMTQIDLLYINSLEGLKRRLIMFLLPLQRFVMLRQRKSWPECLLQRSPSAELKSQTLYLDLKLS